MMPIMSYFQIYESWMEIENFNSTNNIKRLRGRLKDLTDEQNLKNFKLLRYPYSKQQLFKYYEFMHLALLKINCENSNDTLQTEHAYNIWRR